MINKHSSQTHLYGPPLSNAVCVFFSQSLSISHWSEESTGDLVYVSRSLFLGTRFQPRSISLQSLSLTGIISKHYRKYRHNGQGQSTKRNHDKVLLQCFPTAQADEVPRPPSTGSIYFVTGTMNCSWDKIEWQRLSRLHSALNMVQSIRVKQGSRDTI